MKYHVWKFRLKIWASANNVKRVGVTVIGELVEFLTERLDGPRVMQYRSGFILCFDTKIVAKLKQKGCWLDIFDEYFKRLKD